MTTRTHRGRTVRRRRSPFVLLYALLALVAVVGALALVALRRPAAPNADPSIATRPLDAPTGTTPDGFAYKGAPDAPVTVVAYADFQCPACANAFRMVEGTIDQQYVATGKVRVVFHDFPLAQHPHAIPAAAAARCAGAQGAFWPMHDRLFGTQREWTSLADARPMFASYAADLGLDAQAYTACVANPTTTSALQAAFDAAVAQGIDGTPTYVVNGTSVDAASLQTAIDAALRAKGE
jgi:protein-disulfide isomerase